MNKIIAKLAIVLVTVTGLSYGFEVGQQSVCVVLQDLQTNGKFKNQCIRTRNQEDQFVLIDFSMPTCTDCQKNLPGVAAFAKANRDVLTTRIVAISNDKKEITEFIEKNKSLINFPVSFDLKGNAARAYDVIATPTTYVLDPNDKVVFKHIGVLSEADLNKINELIH